MMKKPPKKPSVSCPVIETSTPFKDASAEAKLNWLEETAQLVKDFVSSQKLD